VSAACPLVADAGEPGIGGAASAPDRGHDGSDDFPPRRRWPGRRENHPSPAARSPTRSRSCEDVGVEHILGAVLGVVLLLVGIVCFWLGFNFGVDNRVMIPFFIVGVVLVSAALPVPIWILDRLDGRG
jgi:hypothetical protein